MPKIKFDDKNSQTVIARKIVMKAKQLALSSQPLVSLVEDAVAKNLAFNIIIKEIPDVLDQGIKGWPFNPVVVDSLRRTRLSNLNRFEWV
ncbi:hypothetical protein A0J48_015230 [Sphaerospermopsis aphanizomenoides BCCUSP55]|uniref:hypothetical protein n=1 Tax=Sphaerospermopsis aphanizomenoides TaxID=459663 RepID=UPI00190519B0|nr:hypothetical protein [Sphaerospermopsis aphanizomenoides]MBK1988873.1 hypothetical protein [Sphaerospermopsis aphanizomenoides BCCUSP55]